MGADPDGVLLVDREIYKKLDYTMDTSLYKVNMPRSMASCIQNEYTFVDM